MMNRTRRYMKRYCPKGMLGSACATEIFGAKHLGRNWLDVNTKLVELSGSEISVSVIHGLLISEIYLANRIRQ